MNVSRVFIERPIGTTLLAVGLFLLGLVAYDKLPVASLPSIEFPTIRVNVSRPGADPETMAASVAAPLERRLGEIAGITEMTSVNALGSTSIAMQFDLNRSVDGAARDVQAAINAASADLPTDLPQVPTLRKVNPAASPVIILALTSKTLSTNAIYDAADTVIAQRLSQVEGVAEVTVSGADQPAVRVQTDPALLAGLGVSLDEVRDAIDRANTLAPLGSMSGLKQTVAIRANTEISTPDDYKALIVKRRDDGTVIRLKDVATVVQGTRNTRSSARFNHQPAVLLIITKQPTANVLDTVDRVKTMLPELKKWIPAGVDISILADRTTTIRASVADMQRTLALSVLLVMMVVFVFLRRGTPTIAAGLTVPLSLAGTCAAMWASGYSINNLTLMALAVAVGFVVDDAIVMIENVYRKMEEGLAPIEAAFAGASQIGFTVISISVSLIAAFIPVLFMSGIVGRLLHEFAMTLTFAIAISAVVSLSLTPMICGHFLKRETDNRSGTFDRIVEGTLDAVIGFYGRTLDVVLERKWETLIVLIGTIVLTVNLYATTPKSYFPPDDTGLVIASTEANADVSYATMAELQSRALDVILADPAVAGVGSSVGAGGPNPSMNQGRMFISLKPLAERGGLTTALVIDRLRAPLAKIVGLQTRLVPSQDIRTGARQGKAQYQYTIWSLQLDDLVTWVPKIMGAIKEVPGIVDASTDREQGGLQLNVMIDRGLAARLGVKVSAVDAALANALSQRQISTVYTARNQYRVILEVDPHDQRSTPDLAKIYVPSNTGNAVPLSSLVTLSTSNAPLVVNHQGPFPAVTVSYNLKPGVSLETALVGIDRTLAKLQMPESIRGEPAGDAKSFADQARMQQLLIIAALAAVYIVLGVLYESFAHPLTIISTLPAAGLGALLALRAAGMDLSVIAFIGVILLIGIVKKNGIMLVDFALDAERRLGMPPREAVREACLQRFRPIMMTTLAAILGALPLAFAEGPGSELRRPLGVAIIGGLVVSQVLTLYTTPVIYLLLDRLHRRPRVHAPSELAERTATR